MNDELRGLFPIAVVRGGCLLSDGTAVGIVGGGAPVWELQDRHTQAARGLAYHQLLRSLNYPVSLYILDQPVQRSADLSYIDQRYGATTHPLHRAILDEVVDRVVAAGQTGATRVKQNLWVVSASESPVRSLATLPQVLFRQAKPPAVSTNEALRTAIERARRLASGLSILDGWPPPRLLSPEEIAHCWYVSADMIRALTYPLPEALVARTGRIVTATPEIDVGDHHVTP